MRARAVAISRCIARGCIRIGGCMGSIWKTTGSSAAERRRRNLALRNVTFSRDNLLNLSAIAQYDLITNTDVLEHIEDDRGAMANLARALAPGGYLLLTFPSVPQRRHLKMVAWRERRIGFKPEDIGHVRPGYSPDDDQRAGARGWTRAGEDGVDVRPVRQSRARFVFCARRQQAESDCVRGVAAVSARAELSRKSHADAARLRAARDREEAGRAMKASIFVLMDALGWEWIKEHPFLKEVAPYRRPLDSVLGFSTAAIPSISDRAISRRARAAVVVPSRERALAVLEAELYLRDAAVDGREPLRALRGQNAGAPDERSHRIFPALRGAAELSAEARRVREAQYLRARRDSGIDLDFRPVA